MSESEWHDLQEIDAEAAEFPVASAVNGEDIVIFKNADDYYGVQRLCPHQNADFVRRGAIMGNGKMIRCTLHGFIFKLDTGKGVNAGKQCVDIFEIKRDGSRLKARKKQK
jgi:nitrite reductase/ring-hydroxylating ferredoxin subunit